MLIPHVLTRRQVRLTARPGFTIIEMLVAMALAIFVMMILSQAFVQSLDTFSGTKAIGDMQSMLRGASNAIRHDLIQDHFEGKRRPSDPAFLAQRPREGFFVLSQGGPSIYEGADPDGLPSFRAVNHGLNFTIKMRGNRRENFLSALGPGLTNLNPNYYGATQAADAVFGENNVSYSSSWAEVAYYLVPTGTVVSPSDPAAGGTPLFALYRAQFVVVPDPAAANAAAIANGNIGNYANIACKQGPGGTLIFLGPNELTSDRTLANSPALRGATLLLSNVLSFQVQGLTDPAGDFIDMSYDSNTSGVNLHAVQITIRIWDPATLQARQVTIIQDL